MTVMVVCLQVFAVFSRDRCRKRSEPLGPQQSVGEVKQQAQRDETGEGIIEDHGDFLRSVSRGIDIRAENALRTSEPLAGVGVADGQNEEAEAEGQHEDVEHRMLLVASVPRNRSRGPSLKTTNVPLDAYVFERAPRALL
jgi:hypothetical protein